MEILADLHWIIRWAIYAVAGLVLIKVAVIGAAIVAVAGAFAYAAIADAVMEVKWKCGRWLRKRKEN